MTLSKQLDRGAAASGISVRKPRCAREGAICRHADIAEVPPRFIGLHVTCPLAHNSSLVIRSAAQPA